jgi:hypothetical protein
VGENVDGIRGGTAIGARVKIDVRAGDGDLLADAAPEHGGDGRGLPVPHVGVANECDIGLELLAIGMKEIFEVRAVGFLIAVDENGNLERQRTARF